ncbi:MAG: helix-turn-helix transcriptional regulator [Candidatus Limnocylindria bacterium]
MEQLLTIPQVMERTQLGRTTVFELIARGDLPSVALAGTRTRRVREADLDDWIRREAADQATAIPA